MKNIYHANINKKKSGVAILVLDKRDFRKRNMEIIKIDDKVNKIDKFAASLVKNKRGEPQIINIRNKKKLSL